MEMNEIDARKFAFEFVLKDGCKAEEAFSKAKALSDFLIYGAVPKLKKDTHSDDGAN